MTEREKDLEVLGALKSVAYDQAPPEWWTFMEEQLQAGQRLEDATDIYAEILIDVMAYALTPMPDPSER